ncbi:YjcZ family sporulation protein [Domibacillus sp. PGB-M46]|uniref:YjcZ family sporulation protein n=1 Tax=Domibacillus sp. PGB-M46 TaxID=2910255 RepID=UPI001F55C476|nr:YjcZ family sporulation protein [Domibacillus sp. PGB-M46]MCI2255602.1 YjcZ family sporulation protein [Domibacillus sp. PGB-M46]
MSYEDKGGCEHKGGYGSGFALVVVLFILLIIIGASYVKGDYGYDNKGHYGHGGKGYY